MAYEELVINKILNVLGMNSTRFSVSDTLKSRLAIGHRNGHELPTIENPLPMFQQVDFIQLHLTR